MKKWRETRQVLDRLAELRANGGRAALATVVRVRGSAYRHEGAKMLVAEDGSAVGNVSGGCLEADVREVAQRVIETGLTEHREYCGGTDEIAAWDLGVGCDGVVEVSIRPIGTMLEGEQVESAVRRLLDGGEPFAWCTDLESQASLVVTTDSVTGSLGAPSRDAAAATHVRAMLRDDESGIHLIDGRNIFVDVFTPPPTLLILGRGDDARILERLATEVGFRTQPNDLSSASFAVVMNHNYARDRDALRSLLNTRIRYIGMLGPRQRTERMLAELSAESPVDESRVYGPVGLDIGTDGAEQVAMAIIAEMLAVRSGRRPISLRERGAPIHADTSV